MFLNKLIVLIFFIGCIFRTNAQDDTYIYAADLNFIKNEYTGDLGIGLMNFNNNYYGGGVALSRYFSPLMTLKLESSFGNYGYFVTPDIRFKGQKLDLSMQWVFNLLKADKDLFTDRKKVNPYFAIGVGGAYFLENPKYKATGFFPKEYPMIITGFTLIFPVSLGVKFRLNDRMFMKYEYQYNFMTSDIIDESMNEYNIIYHGSQEKLSDAYGKHLLSLSYLIKTNQHNIKLRYLRKYKDCQCWVD